MPGCRWESKKTTCVALEKAKVGSDLLSQAVTRQVPSAQVSLTNGFGMGPGGPSPRKPPTKKLSAVSDQQKKKGVALASSQASLRATQDRLFRVFGVVFS